jgi:Fic family protein
MAGRKPTVSDFEILQFFVNSNDPFLTTAEVADLAGFSTNSGANKRLSELETEGFVESKKVGRGLAWWITDAGRQYLESGD